MKLPFGKKHIPLAATAVVLLLLFAVACMLYSGFFSLRVITNLFYDNAELGVIAIGMTFVILSGGIDLSVGSVAAFTTIFVATMIQVAHLHPGLAWLLALFLGSAMGCSMGMLIHFFKLPPFLTTLGGMFFVFQTGRPMIRKYDAEGQLQFERHIEGPELDPIIQRLPDRWATPDDGSRPLPAPVVRTAAADRRGRLWVVLQTGHVYVYDGSGEKMRTLVFGGPAPGLTTSLYFTRGGRVLTGPGGYEFDAALSLAKER